MSQEAVLLELDGVTKWFGSSQPDHQRRVLDGVNLKVRAGESLAISGRSGAGKSTLFNIIAALDRPSGGRVLFNGVDLASLDDKAVSLVRSRRIGMIFQLHHLLPQCTVLENVLVPTMVCQSTAVERAEDRAKRLLERVGLGKLLHHRPGQLSGGERQRVAVVRALINQPDLLLADEPTGSLDRTSADNLTQLLIELNREESVALLVATHSPVLAAACGRVLTLRDGVLGEAESDS